MVCPLSFTSCSPSGYGSGDRLSMIHRGAIKKLPRVVGNKLRKNRHLHSPGFRQAASGMDKQGRFIRPLATAGMWGKPGSIGLDQDSVVGNMLGNLAQFVGFPVSYHAGKTDEHPQVDAFLHQRQIPGEGMHHTSQWSSLVGLLEHLQDLLSRFAHVDDEGELFA